MDDPDDPSNSGFGEARRHYRPREKLRWPVVVAVAPAVEPSGAFAGTTLAMTHGVSVAGAFIESDLVVPVGQSLRLWLHPPAPHPPGLPDVLRLSVQVRWQNLFPSRGLPRGFGVQFRAVTSTDEITLHTYFSAHHKVV
ncbi:MAG: PilZ domain-containing protein [Nannocystaceae bacterium]|nr:PilZ domain-containing protein [Nannocystaceae bacterium]